MNRLANFILLLLFSITLTACSVRLTPQDLDQETFTIPSLNHSKPVTILAKLNNTEDITLPIAGPDIVINEDQFSLDLVQRLEKNLKHNGVIIDENAPLSVTIEITHIEIQPDRKMYCVIDFNRKFGDQIFLGFQARSRSWNLKTACEEALNDAVNIILNDQDTMNYLKGE